ncbi:MAG: flagellar hook-length control protein FliK [Pseudomonadota bacterium]
MPDILPILAPQASQKAPVAPDASPSKISSSPPNEGAAQTDEESFDAALAAMETPERPPQDDPARSPETDATTPQIATEAEVTPQGDLIAKIADGVTAAPVYGEQRGIERGGAVSTQPADAALRNATDQLPRQVQAQTLLRPVPEDAAQDVVVAKSEGKELSGIQRVPSQAAQAALAIPERPGPNAPAKPVATAAPQIAAGAQPTPAIAAQAVVLDETTPAAEVETAAPDLDVPTAPRLGPKDAEAFTTRPANVTGTSNAYANAQSTAAGPARQDIVLPEEISQSLQQTSAPGMPAASTAPGSSPVQIAQHAANQIVAALPRDQGVIMTDAGAEISLDPPELGRVRMVVTEVAGGLALTVTAERQETLDLFRKHAQMLADEFAREGLADTNFDFQGEGHASAEDRDGRGTDPAQDYTTDASVTLMPIPPEAGRTNGLDLRL